MDKRTYTGRESVENIEDTGIDERGLNCNGLKPCRCGCTYCRVASDDKVHVGRTVRGNYTIRCHVCGYVMEGDIHTIRNKWNARR